MKIEISQRTIEQLEFDKIFTLVGQYCKGVAGEELLREDLFESDFDRLKGKLDISSDVMNMIQEGQSLSLAEYQDISEDLYLLNKKGYVLAADSVMRIAHTLRNYDSFVRHFDAKKNKTYQHLYALGSLAVYSPLPLVEIDKVFDAKGDIRPDASPELSRISRRILGIAKRMDNEFDLMLKKYREAHQLTQTGESIRGGRRVLVLPVENKRKISGVIHDYSASGKTVYIEPQEVLTLNNDLYELENDKRTEVYRILTTLSEYLRGHHGMIQMVFDRLKHIDVALAKGTFSHRIQGVVPDLVNHPVLEMKAVRHPLLVWQGLESGQQTIPFDLHLKNDNKILLISGPNAGGKSVTLKAIGLIHLMVYNGLLVPLHPESKIGMLRTIYTDIGDHQSIDEGLSTYSSHLTNLKDIVESCDQNSLVLLDEIGSGTDPKLGGAIAEGILNSLIYKKTYGVVTTHYSQLKIYAFHARGIVNGAMLFDKELLTPTYRLKVGKPGSSYAFEVAKKVGLSHHVLRYAQKKVGKKQHLVEQLLIDLQEGKAILDDQLTHVRDERQKLDRLIKNYQDMAKQYDLKRKKLKIKAKEIELSRANHDHHEVQQLINKLEKEKNIEKARELKVSLLDKRKTESSEIDILRKEIFQDKSPDQNIYVGDTVKMLDGDIRGEVLSIQGDKAVVLFGLMQMQVAIADIALAPDQLSINRLRSIDLRGVDFQHDFSPKLDIRGYTLTDAALTLDEFFDKAILNNVKTLEIIHGKGSGKLRNLVLRKMKDYKDFRSYYHPDPERGGDGVTCITM